MSTARPLTAARRSAVPTRMGLVLAGLLAVVNLVSFEPAADPIVAGAKEGSVMRFWVVRLPVIGFPRIQPNGRPGEHHRRRDR